jgi:hypothetical protein
MTDKPIYGQNFRSKFLILIFSGKSCHDSKFSRMVITPEGKALRTNPFRHFISSMPSIKWCMNETNRRVTPWDVPSLVILLHVKNYYWCVHLVVNKTRSTIAHNGACVLCIYLSLWSSQDEEKKTTRYVIDSKQLEVRKTVTHNFFLLIEYEEWRGRIW